MKFVNKILLSLMIACLAACSTSPKTQVVQMGDNELTREQLKAEMVKLDGAEKEINSKKGVNGTNVASVLFWWPGIAYTYYDASEALKLIEQRRSHLAALYNNKQLEYKKSLANNPPLTKKV